MKNFIKGFLFLSLSLICVDIASNKATEYLIGKANTASVSNDTVKGTSYEVTATMYYPVAGQCDSDPLITADGSKIDPKRATEQKMIAMSRDLLSRWGGEFEYGDLVEISGTGEKDGVYRVSDTMNKRIKNTIDILETNGTPLYKYKNIIIRKVLC